MNATSPNAANGLTTLADDFQCTVAGPITNIQLWACFYDDLSPGPNTFVVSIWSDSPSTTGFSQPFQRLWTQTYGPGDYTFVNAGTGERAFLRSVYRAAVAGNQRLAIQLQSVSNQSVLQQGHGTIYWVSVASVFTRFGFPAVGLEDQHQSLVQRGRVSARWTRHRGTCWSVGSHSSTRCCPRRRRLISPSGSAAVRPMLIAIRRSAGWAQRLRTLPPTVWMSGPSHPHSGRRLPLPNRRPDQRVQHLGTWLNDLVDTNAMFQVSLWTDVPAVIGQSPYSHPGSLVCGSLFNPPQTAQSGGAAVLRYQYHQYAANLQEQFYNPNVPGPAGLVGTDTQIWRYDFFPFVPSCFVQDGGPFANGRTYWLTVSYLPQTPGDGNYRFGWKTSTKHWQDAAVFGPSPTWNPMSDPRTGTQLDLAKVVWKFPVTGLTKIW